MRYTYTAVFEPNELEGCSVWFPDLPECYTDGDDFEDAIEMAAEAMMLVIESYIDNARELPEPRPRICFKERREACPCFLRCGYE